MQFIKQGRYTLILFFILLALSNCKEKKDPIEPEVNEEKWHWVSQWLPENRVAVMTLIDSAVLFTTSIKDLYITTTAFETPRKINLTLSNFEYIYDIQSIDRKFFVSTSKNLYFSDDFGNMWNSVFQSSPYGGENGGFIKNNNFYLVSLMSKGIFISNDLMNWKEINKGLPNTITSSGVAYISSVNGDAYATYRENVYKLTMTDSTWNLFNPGIQTEGSVGKYIGRDNLRIIDYSNISGTQNHVAVSKDNGSTWNDTIMDTRYYFLDKDTIYNVGYKTISKTIDFGDSWILIHKGLPDNTYIYTVSVVGDYIYAGTDRGLFRKLK